MRRVRHTQGGGTFPVERPQADWLVVRHRIDHANGHRYEAYDKADPTKPIGVLRYIKDFPKQGVVSFHELWTDPDHRGKGVAVELCVRLHADTPGYSYDPGDNLDDGTGFSRRVLETEPHADGLWYEGRPKPEGEPCTK